MPVSVSPLTRLQLRDNNNPPSPGSEDVQGSPDCSETTHSASPTNTTTVKGPYPNSTTISDRKFNVILYRIEESPPKTPASTG